MANAFASEPMRPPLLIVEDDAQLGALLNRALRSRNFDARLAGGVADALGIIVSHPPAFAVVDLNLPDGSGLEVVDALHRSDPTARIVILTGCGDIATAVAAVRRGAIDYLTKPTRIDEIVRALLAAPLNTIEDDAYEVASVDHVHWQYIQEHLAGAGHNVTVTARRLGMHRRTLQRILRCGPPERYQPLIG